MQPDFNTYIITRKRWSFIISQSVPFRRNVIQRSLWPSFLAVGIAVLRSTSVIAGAKLQRVWFTAEFPCWGTGITAEINTALPVYKQSLARGRFFPSKKKKKSAHGFTSSVVLLLVSVMVLGKGIAESTLLVWRNLLCFFCKAICLICYCCCCFPFFFFPLFSVETSLWLSQAIPHHCSSPVKWQ